MEEQTTTDAPVVDGGQHINGVAIDDQGMAIPQPEATETAEAVTTTETPQEQEVTQEPSTDDNSASNWLKNKGIDPTSPDAVEKVAEMARNAEKAMHAKATKASELEKSLTKTDEEAVSAYEIENNTQISETDKLVRGLVIKEQVRDFFTNKPEAKAYEAKMIEILGSKPHLAGDLESLYAVATIQSGSLDAVKTQAKQETLESLAQKQQAAVPRGNAVNGSGMGAAAITPQNVDQLVAQNGTEWYRANLPAINKALQG